MIEVEISTLLIVGLIGILLGILVGVTLARPSYPVR